MPVPREAPRWRLTAPRTVGIEVRDARALTGTPKHRGCTVAKWRRPSGKPPGGGPGTFTHRDPGPGPLPDVRPGEAGS